MPVPATHPIEAPLIEVFSSIQGEGVLVGCRQVFLRFAKCNLNCDYCDTLFHPQPTYQLEEACGCGTFQQKDNPAQLSDIKNLLDAWTAKHPGLHHSLVLTGGEPLLHADILNAWLSDIISILPVFLETNGTLPDELAKVLPFVEWISMDIKGSAVSGVETPWDMHAAFLTLAVEKLCQVKLVIDDSTTCKEVVRAAKLVNQYAPECPLILQPRTLKAGLSLDGKSLLGLQEAATGAHHDVRVIPQIHPWLGIA